MSDAVRSVAVLRERYRAARLARGWSQPHAAEVAGVSPQVVKRFELGTTTPLLATALKMLTTVGLDIVVCTRGAREPAA